MTHVMDETEILNPQYPSSWWAIGFSDEVGVDEVVPTTALEQKLILWRDGAGGLHCQSAICPHLGANIGYGGCVVDMRVKCPFHGYTYDGSGSLCERPGLKEGLGAERLRLRNFIVEERYGVIFVWNGLGVPDHEIPDVIGPVLEADPSRTAADVTIYHNKFYFPYPAKWFIDNGPDATHFGPVHGMGEWGDVEVLEETSFSMRFLLRFHGMTKALTWSKMRANAKRGELLQNTLQPFAGDLELTTFGSGIHLVRACERVDGNDRLLGRALTFLDSGRSLLCWTPVTERSHVFRGIFIMPTVRTPALGKVAESMIRLVLERRNWGGMAQDTAIFLQRQDAPNPGYSRLDRGLVRFWRFWDSRILDRSLWQGDGIRANGLRAGIRWPDAPGTEVGSLEDVPAAAVAT